MDEWMDGWFRDIHWCLVGCVVVCEDWWMNGCIYGLMCGYVDEWVDVFLGSRVVVWLDG
jgi:hypothetical protein